MKIAARIVLKRPNNGREPINRANFIARALTLASRIESRPIEIGVI
jgi:hypothetical protein